MLKQSIPKIQDGNIVTSNEAAGYSVTKSGASLGLWDLVAVSPTDFILVQVKSNRPPAPAEREQLKGFRCPLNCRKLIHIGCSTLPRC